MGIGEQHARFGRMRQPGDEIGEQQPRRRLVGLDERAQIAAESGHGGIPGARRGGDELSDACYQCCGSSSIRGPPSRKFLTSRVGITVIILVKSIFLGSLKRLILLTYFFQAAVSLRSLRICTKWLILL